jgi:hypothetical protein
LLVLRGFWLIVEESSLVSACAEVHFSPVYSMN